MIMLVLEFDIKDITSREAKTTSLIVMEVLSVKKPSTQIYIRLTDCEFLAPIVGRTCCNGGCLMTHARSCVGVANVRA